MSKLDVIKRLYVVFPTGGPFKEGWEDIVLGDALKHLNHNGDVYFLAEDPLSVWEGFSRALELLNSFLTEAPFVRIRLRPVQRVRVGWGSELRDMYRVVSAMGKGFYQEALYHQVASRWMVLPILRVSSPQELREAMDLALFMRNRMILPSYCMARFQGMREMISRLDPSRERIMLEGPKGIIDVLFDNDLLDELMDWALSSRGGFSVHGCSSAVIDLERGQIRRCPRENPMPLGSWERLVQENAQLETCLDCWMGLIPRISEEIDLNRRHEEAARLSHQLGVLAMSRGDEALAGGLLLQAQKEIADPVTRGENLLYLGILNLAQGRLQEAHEALTQALSLLPDSGSVRYHLGRCEFAWRDFIAASDLFKEALEKGLEGKQRDEALLQLGICHIQLEEFKEAREALERVKEEGAPVKFYRGVALLGEGKVKEAQAFLLDALNSSPDQEDLESILFYIAHCHKELGEFREACSWLEKTLEVEPRSYQAWNLLGYCRYRLGLYHDSIEAFLKALELNPRSALDMANIGSNLRELGDTLGAIKWYKMALSLDPTLSFAAEGLRRLDKTLGNDPTRP